MAKNSVGEKFPFFQKIRLEITIDHFTVVCSVARPLNGSEARGDLVLIQTSLLLFCKSSCSDANGLHLHEKSREVCINARSTPASLSFIQWLGY